MQKDVTVLYFSEACQLPVLRGSSIGLGLSALRNTGPKIFGPECSKRMDGEAGRIPGPARSPELTHATFYSMAS